MSQKIIYQENFRKKVTLQVNLPKSRKLNKKAGLTMDKRKKRSKYKSQSVKKI